MPLAGPSPRKLIHTNEIRCTGIERDDGLWDIEGRITDVKCYSYETQDRGGINDADSPLVKRLWPVALPALNSPRAGQRPIWPGPNLQAGTGIPIVSA